MSKFNDSAKEQAAAQASSIVDMLAAVNCDYARLEELNGEREELEESANEAQEAHSEAIKARTGDVDSWRALSDANEALANWEDENGEELKTLQAEAGDNESEEEARERIQEDPLEIQVLSGWTNPGEELKATEFMILLCTGGPAVRIVGELSEHGEPQRAWMEFQDWGTPWTCFYDVESDTLVEYASHFYFGR